jgi:hypothetical protein
MKMLLLAGTALLAFAASDPAVHAQRVNFTYTGKLVSWTVPKTGRTRSSPLGRRAVRALFQGCRARP